MLFAILMTISAVESFTNFNIERSTCEIIYDNLRYIILRFSRSICDSLVAFHNDLGFVLDKFNRLIHYSNFESFNWCVESICELTMFMSCFKCIWIDEFLKWFLLFQNSKISLLIIGVNFYFYSFICYMWPCLWV